MTPIFIKQGEVYVFFPLLILDSIALGDSHEMQGIPQENNAILQIACVSIFGEFACAIFFDFLIHFMKPLSSVKVLNILTKHIASL